MMLLRHSAIYVAAKGVPSVLGFATNMALTWLLLPVEYGIYGLNMSVVILAANTLFDWQGLSVTRWYQARSKQPSFLPTVMGLFAATCAVSLVLCAAIAATGVLPVRQTHLWLALLGTWAYGWFELIGRLQVVQMHPGRYFVQNVTRNGLILVCATLVAGQTGSAEATLAASFASILLAGAIYSNGLWRFPWRLNRELTFSFLAYGWPMGVVTLLSALNAFASRALVAGLAGGAAAGYFTAASVLVQNTISLIGLGVGNAGYAFAVNAVGSESPPRVRRLLERNIVLLTALLLPAGTAMSLLMPMLAPLVLAPAFVAPVVEMTPWLAAGSVLFALRSYYVDLAFQLGPHTKVLSRIGLTATAVSITLSYLLIPVVGPVGACMAYAASGAAAKLHALIAARRAYPLPWPLTALAQVAAATGVMAAAMLVTPALAGALGPGVATLVGIITYGAAMFALDPLHYFLNRRNSQC